MTQYVTWIAKDSYCDFQWTIGWYDGENYNIVVAKHSTGLLVNYSLRAPPVGWKYDYHEFVYEKV